MAGSRDAGGGLWERLGRWRGRTDLTALIAVLASVAGVWAFLAVADAVTEGESGHTDARILRSLREPADPADPVGPRWLEEAARDVTALGGFAVLSLLVAVVVGYLLLGRQYPAAALVLASALGGLLVSHLLKGFYDRPRPALVPHLARVSTPSFPSGHAMLSAAVYLTLGALLAARRRVGETVPGGRGRGLDAPGRGQPGVPRGPLPDGRRRRLVGRVGVGDPLLADRPSPAAAGAGGGGQALRVGRASRPA